MSTAKLGEPRVSRPGAALSRPSRLYARVNTSRMAPSVPMSTLHHRSSRPERASSRWARGSCAAAVRRVETRPHPCSCRTQPGSVGSVCRKPHKSGRGDQRARHDAAGHEGRQGHTNGRAQAKAAASNPCGGLPSRVVGQLTTEGGADGGTKLPLKESQQVVLQDVPNEAHVVHDLGRVSTLPGEDHLHGA